MGQHTNIQWADDTVNPTTGCDGCELWVPGRGGPCYAGNLHENRLAKSLPALYAPTFTEVRLAPGRMMKAARARDLTGTARPDKPWLDGLPRVIFVGDLADVFSDDVSFTYLFAELMMVAGSGLGARHVWMVLTKRPKRMVAFALWLLDEYGWSWPRNVWVGTSVTGKASLSRMDHLMAVPAAVRFASLEPLIEAVSIRPWLDSRGLGLVILGGESHQAPFRARPFDAAWAHAVRHECFEAGVAFFMKQVGSNPQEYGNGLEWPEGTRFRKGTENGSAVVLKDHHGGDWSEWPAALRVRQMPAWRTA